MTESSAKIAPARNRPHGEDRHHHHTKTFGDYVAVLKRRWKLIAVLFVLIFLPGVYFAYSLPPMYRSTATFLVKQQSIREDIVQTTVTGFTDELIQEVGQRVMSTSNLIPLIEKYDLYPEVNQISIGQAIQRLRKSTFYEPETAEVINPRTGRTMLTTVRFDISFEYRSPETAQQVAAELAQLYLDENSRSRFDQVQATIDFLEADIERIVAEVQRTDQALTEFREKHASNLPNLENYHLQLAERTERQIDALDEEMRQVRDRKIELEGQMRGLAPFAPSFDENGNPIIGSGERLSELRRERLRLLSLYSSEHPDIKRIEKEIEALSGSSDIGSDAYSIQVQIDNARAELAAAKQRYSEDHPDVRQMQRELATLESQLAGARRQQPQRTQAVAMSPEAQQLQELIDAAASDLRALNQRRAELVRQLNDTESKLSALPGIIGEFSRLTSEHEQALARQREARDKLDEARMAERLETGGGGQRFIVIGDPQVPAEPYQPIRTAIFILVTVLGIGAGIIVATVIDTLNNTVKSSRDLLEITGTPALAVIPYLENAAERRARTGKNAAVIGLLASSIVAAVIISQTMG